MSNTFTQMKKLAVLLGIASAGLWVSLPTWAQSVSDTRSESPADVAQTDDSEVPSSDPLSPSDPSVDDSLTPTEPTGDALGPTEDPITVPPDATVDPTDDSITDPSVDPTDDSITDPGDDSLTEPTDDSLSDPTGGSLSDPTDDSLSDPTGGSLSDPTDSTITPTDDSVIDPADGAIAPSDDSMGESFDGSAVPAEPTAEPLTPSDSLTKGSASGDEMSETAQTVEPTTASFSPEELQQFANLIPEMQSIQMSAQAEVAAAIDESGLSRERFGQMFQATTVPEAGAEIDASAEEQESFEMALAEIQQIEQEVMTQREQVLESEGMTPERFNEILGAVQQDPELQQQIQSLMEN